MSKNEIEDNPLGNGTAVRVFVEEENALIERLEKKGLEWVGKSGMRPWLMARRARQLRFDAVKTLSDRAGKPTPVPTEREFEAARDEFEDELERCNEDYVAFCSEIGEDPDDWTKSDDEAVEKRRNKRLREPRGVPETPDPKKPFDKAPEWEDYDEYSEAEDEKDAEEREAKRPRESDSECDDDDDEVEVVFEKDEDE